MDKDLSLRSALRCALHCSTIVSKKDRNSWSDEGGVSLFFSPNYDIIWGQIASLISTVVLSYLPFQNSQLLLGNRPIGQSQLPNNTYLTNCFNHRLDDHGTSLHPVGKWSQDAKSKLREIAEKRADDVEEVMSHLEKTLLPLGLLLCSSVS